MTTPKQDVVDDARRLAGGGASLEMILVFLREKGFDKIDSINTVRALFGKSMMEAKQIVDHSEAWSDRFFRDVQFRETAWKALRDIAASQDPNLPKIIVEGDADESESNETE
jgi:ribosomal protein L7/L12